MDIYRDTFGEVNGHLVTRITLVNDHGVEVKCMSLGATWLAFSVPDDDHKKRNLLVAHDTAEEYTQNGFCLCKSIGRVAGRIKGGHCTLNGKDYQLPQNEGTTTLHGGPNGMMTKNFRATTARSQNAVSAIFQRKLTEADDGFPGDLLVTVIYTLDNHNQVTITYTGLAGDEDTLFNPTCHAYFNMGTGRDLSETTLQINASNRLELDDDLLPTGNLVPVKKTAFDFTTPKNVLATLKDYPQGFDDVFVVNEPGHGVGPIATLTDSGHKHEVQIFSARDGLVMYTMNGMDEGVSFSQDNGAQAKPHEGVALEAQTLPDAIHQPNFGDIVLKAGSKKSHRIRFVYKQH